MNKVTAIAVLTRSYLGSQSGSVQMRTIEIKTRAGKPLAVLQSEDTPPAIESTLRENGWSVVTWKGKYLQLSEVVNVGAETSASVKTTPPPTKAANIFAGIVVTLLILMFVSCSVSFSNSVSKSVEEEKAEPKVGDVIMAEVMCEEFVKTKLNAPSTAKFSRQEGTQDPSVPTKYTVVGFVEAENRLGGMVGSRYRCDMNYLPDTDKWSSDTFLAED